jgi:hypothetical protein
MGHELVTKFSWRRIKQPTTTVMKERVVCMIFNVQVEDDHQETTGLFTSFFLRVFFISIKIY